MSIHLQALRLLEEAQQAHTAGRWKHAIASYRQVLAINPRHRGAANNLAWILATCPDRAWRDGATAVALMQWAAEPGVSTWQYVGTLAAAYAEAGDFEQALAWGRKSQALANGTDEGRWVMWLGALEGHRPIRQDAQSD